MSEPKTFTPIRGMIECAAGGSYVSAKDYDKQRKRILALEAALRFYAERQHIIVDEAWETEHMDGTSEAPNLLCIDDLPIMIEDGSVASALLHDKETCQHEWVDARNDVVLSGEICVKCHTVRAGGQEFKRRSGDE